MSNPNFKNAKWDPHGSTFRHNIYYSCGRIVTGYTKKKNLPETPVDKTALLAGLLVRLKRDNYFNSPTQVKGLFGQFLNLDFFTNIKGKGWVYMATIYPEYMKVNQEVIKPNIGNMLSDFIKNFNDGSPESFINKYKTINKQLPPNLDLSQHSLVTKFILQNHCKRLLDLDLEPEGLVQEFYRKYCFKFFGDFTAEDQSFYDSLQFYKDKS